MFTFGGRLHFSVGSTDIELVAFHHSSELDRARALDGQRAVAMAEFGLPLAGGWDEPFLRPALLEVLSEARGAWLAWDLSQQATEDLRDALVAEVAAGRVLVVARAHESVPIAPPRPRATVAQPVVVGQAPAQLMNLVWVEDETTSAKQISSACIGDPVWLRVEATGLERGDAVSFTVQDADTQEITAPLRGRVAEADERLVAVVGWIVPEWSGAAAVVPKQTQFKAIAQARDDAEAQGPTLDIVPFTWELLLEIDVNDPKSADDELLLMDAHDQEVERIRVADLPPHSADWVIAKFEKARRHGRYSLIRDHGPDEEGGIDPLFVDVSPAELQAYAQDSAAVGRRSST